MDSLFQQQVFEITQLIPEGRVTTYGTIAKAVGYPNHSRQVGRTLRHCDEKIPAHRVCHSCGKIPENCLDEFTEKLKQEGIEIKGNKIQNYKTVFWNPLEEL
ncbi:MAG: MGMT family protein [Cruoricaptor ignavus]|nr:MGMT family protein [Cruoricaptor ignavus]